MSKKRRAWFVCPQWADLISQHYADDAEAGRALRVDPRVLAKLRSRAPIAKSTVLKMLRRLAGRQNHGTVAAALVVDTRSRL